MDGYLKASTATTIWVGPYLSTDGLTAKSNLKVSVGVFQIAKNGAAFANKTHTSIPVLTAPGGWYTTRLSVADVDTVGVLQYKSKISSYPPVWGAYTILPKTIYSGWFGGGYLPVNAVQIEGVDATNQLSTSVGARGATFAAQVKSLGTNYVGSVGLVKKMATSVISNPVIATGALSGGNLTANAKGSIGTAVWLNSTKAITQLPANGLSAAVVTDDVMTSIATAVWNRSLTTHSTAGTAGKRLAGIGIPKGVAFPNVTFLMVDATDNVTPKTGLTPTATVSRDGGAFAAAAGTVAEIASGYYQFDATATDMSGGIVTFKFAGTDAADTTLTIRTVT